MEDVEVTGVAKLERPSKRERIHPGEDGVKEVAGYVETLIAPSQLHQITAGSEEHNRFS